MGDVSGEKSRNPFNHHQEQGTGSDNESAVASEGVSHSCVHKGFPFIRTHSRALIAPTTPASLFGGERKGPELSHSRHRFVQADMHCVLLSW